MGFPGGSVVKKNKKKKKIYIYILANAGGVGSIPGLGRPPGEGNGNPLQYSCPRNPVEGGTWWAIVEGVTKDMT